MDDERSAMRRDAEAAFRAGLAAVDPRAAVARSFAGPGVVDLAAGRLELASFARVRVAAVGKAATGMAEAWRAHAGAPSEGLVVAPRADPVEGFRALAGEHPVPGPGSLEAGEALLALAAAADAEDLFVLLLSGGASALAEAPRVPLSDLRATTRLLLASGAPIDVVNTVRRRLSRLKGGGLAEAAGRGTVATLAISDVVGDDPAAIGSGPTVPDPSPPGAARAALEARGLLAKLPASVARVLADEPPPPRAAPRGGFRLVASNATAVDAARAALAARGWRVAPALALAGEARDAGRAFAARALAERGPVALVAGGETTVSLGLDAGVGGRNQETALAMVEGLAGRRVVALVAGTDGVDGPTHAAGAFADGTSLERARAAGLDVPAALARHASTHVFATLDDLFVTGPTGTNVADLAIALSREDGP
ncbi:MAG TPA: DUF4147 domain-containing protein [Candidatus Thermoplasmatota archaeon]|nr:DUF4147 domain-containing protein [Candidatus Thermoplasmatota archaeon]